jgi:translation initiation factor IF-2
MTEMGTLKVFELAKELGMDSIGLLDVLKNIGVEVKSHMSSLESAQAQAARDFIQKPKASAKTATKAVKRSTVKKASATEAAAPTPAKAPSKTKAKALAAKAAEVAPASRTKVIKRRSSKDEEEAAQGAIQEEGHNQALADAPLEEEFATYETAAEETEVAHEEAHAEVESEAVLVSDNTSSPSPSIVEPAAPTLVAATPAPVVEPAKPKPSTLVRRAVTTIQDDEMLDRSLGQRRLKIIQAAPPEPPKRPVAKIAEDKETAAANKAAMFKPMTSVLGDQSEDGDRKRRTGEVERKVEEIKITDFRKREIIFQPKRRKLPPGKVLRKTEITTPSAQKRKIRIEKTISIADLAMRMSEKPGAIVKKLIGLGVDFGENLKFQLDLETATLIATEFQYEIENVAFDETKLLVAQSSADESKMKPRPPVITVMGHVDHGKTTLLDAIRNASVATGEAGGITQHIGAYSVQIDKTLITFLDTPGHEAFNAIRKRGANATDIVVLVVAADDGIMPQTKEAIQLAHAASVPIIVAANKVDKREANLERLKQMLSEQSVLVEEWGGEVPLIPVSALKKTGIKELLEAISLQAEMLELKANPDRLAEGVVLEARMQTGRGIVADVLVQEGTLRTGDFIVCGPAYGRVRSMMNDQGKTVKEVLPGLPVEFAGLGDVPGAGEKFYCVKSEADAKEIASHRQEEIRLEKEKSSEKKPLTLDELFAAEDAVAGKKQLNIMLKADVFGSLEAIAESVAAIKSDKVALKVVSKGVGPITDNDVVMALTSKAQIFGFNVKPDSKAKDKAKREEVKILSHSIIYELIDGVKESMESLLDPIRIEKPIGKAEVKQAFAVSKIGLVAGSIVVDGKIVRNAWAKVYRGNDVLLENTVVSLKRFKDDAKETIKGQECGIGINTYEDIRAGDRIEAFLVEFEKARL